MLARRQTPGSELSGAAHTPSDRSAELVDLWQLKDFFFFASLRPMFSTEEKAAGT